MKNAKRRSVPAREAVPDWVEDLFRRNRDWLLTLALRLSRNRAQAEELTQEAFTRLVAKARGISPFPSDYACRKWLGKALRWVLVDRYRKEQAHEDRGTDPSAESLQPLESPDELQPDRRLVMELMRQAASELPPALRATFDLYARDMDYEEMARRLNIKSNALRKRLHGMRHRMTRSLVLKLKARGMTIEESAELLSMRESKIREILDAVPSPDEDE